MEYNVETPFIKIWIEENILHSIFAEKLDIDLEIAKNCVSARIAFSQGVSYPCLIDMKGVRSVTKDARNYFADEGSRLITAGAMIIGNPLTKMIGNIFLQINNPKVPVKLFTDEGKAKEWLKQYL